MKATPTEPDLFYGLQRLLDDKRGLHLQDPDETRDRAWLEGIRDAGTISPYGWMLLAILHFQAGRYEEVLQALEPIITHERQGLPARVIGAAALARAGRATEALAQLAPTAGGDTLDALAEPGPAHDDFGPSFLVAARADALWHAGERERAFVLAARATEIPEAPASRRQEYLQYAAALGRWSTVLDALAQLEESDRRSEDLFAAALAHTALGRPDEARAMLEPILKWNRELRAKVRAHPGFAGVPWLDALCPLPSAAWIRKRKDIAALVDHPGLAAAGVRWIDEDESREGTKEHCGRYKRKTYTRGLLWSEHWWDACAALTKSLVMVAELPAAHRRTMVDEHGALFHDKKDPGHIWFAPSPELPAYLWIRLPAEPQAILDAMAWFYPVKHRARTELPICVRAWAGDMRALVVPNPYTGQLEAAGSHEIERFWVSSAVVDALGWGSAFDEDPWPNVLHMGGGLRIMSAMREYGANADGGLPRMNRRSTLSRSHISLEIHPEFQYVWELRYRPSPFTASMERFNATTGFRLPLDLPLDLAAAIQGFEWGPHEWLERQLADPKNSGGLHQLVMIAAAVEYGDLRGAARLRQYAAHPDPNVAAAAINAMIRYNMPFLLSEAGLLPLPADYLPVMAERVDEGIGAPPVSDEPYDEGDDDDEYDDDDDDLEDE